VDVAKAIPGLGTDDLVPLVHPNLDHNLGGLSAEDYFVLTRIDGQTTLHHVILICGLPEARAVEALKRMRSAGAIYFKGEQPPVPKAVKPPAPPPITQPLSRLDEAVLAEPCDLTMDQKRMILMKHQAIGKGTLFELLEVAPDVDVRGLRASYFRLSKDFHPDRFYGKKLGSYQRRLTDIFEMMSKAFNLLIDDSQRADYIARMEEERAAGTRTPDDTTHVRRPGRPGSNTDV